MEDRPRASDDLPPEEVNLRKESKELPAKLINPKEYPICALRMKLHFQSISVWDVVDGRRRPLPDTASTLAEKKDRKDRSRAHSDLLRCIGNAYQQLCATYTSAQELWLALKDLFQPEDNTQLLGLQLHLEALESSEPFTKCLLTLKQL